MENPDTTLPWLFFDGDRVNLGRRGNLAHHALAKSGEPIHGSLEVNDDPVGRVPDPAGQPKPRGQPNHERPEADALHPTQQTHPHRGEARGGGWTASRFRAVNPAAVDHFPVLPDGT